MDVQVLRRLAAASLLILVSWAVATQANIARSPSSSTSFAYLSWNFSSGIPPCDNCPAGHTQHLAGSLCSSDLENWAAGGHQMFHDPIPAGHKLLNVRVVYWGRFLCESNVTSFVAFLMSEVVANVTLSSLSGYESGCSCSNCVDRWEHITGDFGPTNTYGYDKENLFFVGFVSQGVMCISQVEMYLYYFREPPQITALSPRAGPVSGGTIITIHGAGFSFEPGSKVYCLFGDSDPVVSIFHGSNSTQCQVPALVGIAAGSVIGVRVSNDARRWSEASLPFYVYEDIEVNAISPSKARASAFIPTTVTLAGKHFAENPAFDAVLRCSFGGAPSSNVSIASPTSARCATPAGVEGPSTVTLSVSLNGQQWHSCSNCTFTFYEEQDNLPFFLWLAVASVVLLLVIVVIVARAAKSCQKSEPPTSGVRQPLLSTNSDVAAEFDKQIDMTEIRIGQRIGKGSFGEVYLGTWNGTAVAVKKLPASKLTDEFLREFAREARLMRTLRHPNVIQFLGASFDPPDICIVTEYMPLGSLYHLIHDKSVQLSWARVKKVAIDAAKGMAYLHNSNPAIIHRDLKSHNLLVDENWKVKVCDFGLSRRIYEDTQANTLTMCGTPCYTAPEILRNAHYTTKADVYSFGVVLWELVTREEPFSGMPPFQVIFAVGTKGARPEVPSWCPPEMTKLIQMCWADDTNVRPAFNQIIEYLEKWNV